MPSPKSTSTARPSPSSSACWKTSPAPEGRGHYVYVAVCADGTLYTGYAVDVGKRLAAHNAGRGARYTRARRPVALAAWTAYADKGGAMAAEAAFKRLDRPSKLAAIAASQARPPGPSAYGFKTT